MEIWRSLASLCIKNGYTELLKTCISHLKSPVVSLLLRASNNTAKKQNSQHGGFAQSSSQDDHELAAVLSVALAELPAGVQLVANKPILHSKVMQETGLETLNLLDDIQSQTIGFNSITRKSNVHVLAQRLYAIGDYAGTNACYNELFGSARAVEERSKEDTGSQ